MRPEAAAFLAKARSDLEDARKIMGIPLAAIAARTAYYAAFHAAEALIVERTGRIAKTHAGVRSEFARLQQTPSYDRTLMRFLASAYKHKENSDYGIGESAISERNALDAIDGAESFIAAVASWLEHG